MRSIGIDPGDHSIKVVELEGSYKKTRLSRVQVARSSVSTDPMVRAEAVAEAARAGKDDGMNGEITLGHPCREAVLRTLDLPFKGHDAIRKVVKSEIEGEIQSQSVDDMVVDFHEVGPGATGGTKILVASVPKAGLRTQIAALTAQKIEPETIDLDTMALWRAAHWAGAFAAADDAKSAGAAAIPITAVVEIGARSTKVLLVESEQLVEMRTLRMGDAVVADEIARKHGLDVAVARDAVQKALSSGADQRIDVAALPLAAAVGGGTAADPAVAQPAEGSPAAAARTVTITGTEVEAAHTAYLQRLARELTRFLASTGRTGRLQAAFCTGGASRLAGTHEMLEAVLGVPVKELDVLGKLQHDLDSDQVKELGARLTTAVGLALSRLGGPEGFQLRQEDLVLTRGFERAKFPLAIACMVALVALFVVANKRTTELRLLELEIGSTFLDKKNPKATPQFFGMLFEVFKGGWFENPLHFRLEQSKGKDYTAKDLTAELVAAPVHRRIGIVHDRLKAVANQKQKESGIYEDVSLESGLAVLVRWAELLNRVESQLGRFLVTKVELSMKGQTRRLEFWVAFRDSDFRTRRSALQREIDAELQKADSPFVVPPKSDDRKDEERFRDTEKGGMPGAYYRVTLHVKDSFRPFGVGGTPARAADPQGGEK